MKNTIIRRQTGELLFRRDCHAFNIEDQFLRSPIRVVF